MHRKDKGSDSEGKLDSSRIKGNPNGRSYRKLLCIHTGMPGVFLQRLYRGGSGASCFPKGSDDLR